MKFILLFSLIAGMTYTMRISRDDSTGSLNDDDFETEESESGKIEVKKNFAEDPAVKKKEAPPKRAETKDKDQKKQEISTNDNSETIVSSETTPPKDKSKEGEKDKPASKSEIQYEGMIVVPDSQKPQFYKPPPNLTKEKTLMNIVDVFNPSQLPELTPAYPEYDVLPEVDHFWQSFTPLVKDKKKIEEVDVIKGYSKALRSYKKEVFQNEDQSTEQIRKERKIYDPNWLAKQLKISRIVYLEDMLTKNKNKNKSKQ